MWSLFGVLTIGVIVGAVLLVRRRRRLRRRDIKVYLDGLISRDVQ